MLTDQQIDTLDDLYHNTFTGYLTRREAEAADMFDFQEERYPASNSAIRAVVQESEKMRSCGWIEDEDSGAYDTECGHTFLLNDDTPAVNQMFFCCFCGGHLVASAA